MTEMNGPLVGTCGNKDHVIILYLIMVLKHQRFKIIVCTFSESNHIKTCKVPYCYYKICSIYIESYNKYI